MFADKKISGEIKIKNINNVIGWEGTSVAAR